MAWKLTIGGTDYSAVTEYSSWRITRSSRHRGATLSGSVLISGKALQRPLGFQQIILQDASSLVRRFGGLVQKVTQREVNATTFEYVINASDYTRWLDHVPAGGNTYSGTIDAVVKSLLNDWATRTTGVNTALGDPPPSVPITTTATSVPPLGASVLSYQPSYIPLSQVFDDLAKQSNAIWFVDENAVLWFLLPDNVNLQAPLATTSVTYFNQDLTGSSVRGTVTETLPTLDADAATSNLPGGTTAVSTYRNLTLTEDVSDTISGVTIRDYLEASTSTLTESTVQKLTGDGTTHFFKLSQVPIDPAHTTVTVGGTKTYSTANANLKTEYLDGQPSAPTSDDWCFVCQSNQGIRFNLAPANAAAIDVVYNYEFQGADIQKNPPLAAEIARREAFGPGYYYAHIPGGGSSSSIVLTQGTPTWLAAELVMLYRYSRVKVLAHFETFILGWRPGQVFAIVSANRGDSTLQGGGTFDPWNANYAGTIKFSQRMFVTQVQEQLMNNSQVLTTIDAVSDVWGL